MISFVVDHLAPAVSTGTTRTAMESTNTGMVTPVTDSRCNAPVLLTVGEV